MGPSTKIGRIPNKDKVIPEYQLGVNALPAKTPTMQGVLNWLKSERLHKYWPVFSRLSYRTIVGLTDSNLDEIFRSIGAQPMTSGARGRVLRCALGLRQRPDMLSKINTTTSIKDAVCTFNPILQTPLSLVEGPDGADLIQLLRLKLLMLVVIHGVEIFKQQPFREVFTTYSSRQEIPKADRVLALNILEYASKRESMNYSPNEDSQHSCHSPSSMSLTDVPPKIINNQKSTTPEFFSYFEHNQPQTDFQPIKPGPNQQPNDPVEPTTANLSPNIIDRSELATSFTKHNTKQYFKTLLLYLEQYYQNNPELQPKEVDNPAASRSPDAFPNSTKLCKIPRDNKRSSRYTEYTHFPDSDPLLTWPKQETLSLMSSQMKYTLQEQPDDWNVTWGSMQNQTILNLNVLISTT